MLNELKTTVNISNSHFSDSHRYRERISAMFGNLSEEEQNAQCKAWVTRWEALRNRLAEELARGVSIHHFAKEADLSGEHLDAWSKDFSHFRISRRDGEESMAATIERTLEEKFTQLDAERASETQVDDPLVETSVVRDVILAINKARKLGVIVDFSAPAGNGKTSGIKEYVKRARKSEGFDCPVWTITMTPVHCSLRGFLGLIAQEGMGIGTYEGRTDYRLFEQIKSAAQGRGGVLIIDEAQQILNAGGTNTMDIMNQLRSFHDAKVFGVVLLGNNEIYQHFSKIGANQIWQRLASDRIENKGATEADIELIMNAFNVKGAAEKALCKRIVNVSGGLRQLVRTFQNAKFSYGDVSLSALELVSSVFLKPERIRK